MTFSDKPMHGKVCIITGAASGIGAATAQALAQQGATMILVDRDVEKGAITVAQIKQQTGNPSVELMAADLSSQQEIRRLAQQFKSRYQRLDVLLNNAGAIFAERQESVDGIEMTFALNYLGYFLLTNLLLDTLKAGAPARIINTSSRSHARARINFDDLESRTNYQGLSAYAHSKLAIVLFTYALARRLEGAGVMVNALHPGIVATNFGRGSDGALGFVMRLFRPAFLSPEQGAQTGIYLATSGEVAGVTGKYFVKCKAVPSAPASYDTAIASRLWEVSEAYTKLRREA
ncbi:MAG TPA: SDR family NAD(P)-dependent oxidoreductase [Anaerolineae bacterium]|nr:SDR family NAD(P)-dependent oxidoreductase [Anaerolineae bacterium]HQI84053.1 SDR family NAD(P)-dependent oxidoreductase [Anaerolineae bacterium]